MPPGFRAPVLQARARIYVGFSQGGAEESRGLLSREGLFSSEGLLSTEGILFTEPMASSLQRSSFLQMVSFQHMASYLQRASSLLRSQRGPSGQTQSLVVIHRRPQEVRSTLTLRLVREP